MGASSRWELGAVMFCCSAADLTFRFFEGGLPVLSSIDSKMHYVQSDGVLETGIASPISSR